MPLMKMHHTLMNSKPPKVKRNSDKRTARENQTPDLLFTKGDKVARNTAISSSSQVLRCQHESVHMLGAALGNVALNGLAYPRRRV